MSTLTTNLQLTKPDVNDKYDIGVQNDNLDKIDVAIKELNDKNIDLTGYATEAFVSAAIEPKANRTELFSKKYSDLTGTPTSLPANGGNAATVNGFTVASNVPSDAKFTDTVYTHPSTHPYSMITGVPTSLPANGGNSDTVDNFHLAVVDALPSSQVSNTIYFVKG